MVSDLVPVKIDPAMADRDLWKRFHELRRIKSAEMWPDDPVRPDDVVEIRMTHPDSFDIREYFEMSHDGVMISTFGGETVKPANPEYETNKHLYWADAYVRPEYRRRGIATRWLEVLAQQMDAHGCTVVGMTAQHDEAKAFLSWLGAEV